MPGAHAAICSAALGTSRLTRRIALINCVTVSCVATASARMAGSAARRRRPFKTRFCSTILRTASLTRRGRTDFAIRFRQYTSDDGLNPGSSRLAPMATFHRTSNFTASAISRSE